MPGATIHDALALADSGRAAEAAEIARALADRGDGAAFALLGHMHWRGDGVARDPVAARELFRRGGELGNRSAAAAYTNLLASGIAGPRSWEEALRRLTREASADPRRRAVLELLDAMALDPAGDPAELPPGEQVHEAADLRRSPGLLSRAERHWLVAVAKRSFRPSLVRNDAGEVRPDPVRTSDGAVLHWLIEDPAIHAINRRLAAVTGTPVENGEPLLILRYGPGQEYRRHFDYNPADANHRVMTALVYLNDGFTGGETEFGRSGAIVKPRAGDAVTFRNARDDGSLDPLSEHAGLPVVTGTKLLATRWIHQRRWEG